MSEVPRPTSTIDPSATVFDDRADEMDAPAPIVRSRSLVLVSTTAEPPPDTHRVRQELLEIVAANTSDITVVMSLDGCIEWTSREVHLWEDERTASLSGPVPWEQFHPDDMPLVTEAFARILVVGHSGDPVRMRLRSLAGTYRWVEADGHRLRIAGEPKLVVRFRDVDHTVRATQALRDSELRFRTLAENATDVVYTMDLTGAITWVSPSCTEILGWSPDEMVGHRVRDFLHPDDIAANMAVIRQVIDGGGERGQAVVRYLSKSREWLWVGITGRVIRDADGAPVSGIESLRDVSGEVAARMALAEAALHDPLTDLGNRAALIDEIGRALSASLRREKACAVLLLDLDHFKFVNDSLGHATGDDLIRQAAARIRATVRDGDFVGRHGGDEFVVVMRDLEDPAEAMRAGQRLVDAFRVAFDLGVTEIYATASVGVSISRGGTDVETILAEADTAMYVAKDDGRDRASLFNDELRAAVTERLHLESGLRHALEHGELDVWYQPEVDIRTGGICAVEALLRWNHPDGVIRTAADFIEVAEDSGLIVEFGRFVIRQACRDAAHWVAEHPELPVAVRVNLSTRQLAEPELLPMIDDALRAARLPASALCFEITESAILREIPTVTANLEGIHRRGIQLAVDDFGTGYASLTYLRQLPIAVLKLDRTFVQNLPASDVDRRVVAGIIGLARNLDITVTAEGVERPEQASLLSALGCHRAQGYLYAAAMPVCELDALLASSAAAAARR